jgi:hypothetical protein
LTLALLPELPWLAVAGAVTAVLPVVLALVELAFGVLSTAYLLSRNVTIGSVLLEELFNP